MENVNISQATLKQLEQIVAKKKSYVVKFNKKDRRSLGLNPTIDELYEFVATMAKDLKEQGIYK